MKTAREIIMNALNEELPFITEEIRDVVAERIIREAGLENVQYLNIKTNNSPRETVRYNVELSLEDIALVEKYNGGSFPALFLDTYYIHLLKRYFKVLGKNSCNTLEVGNEEYIKNVLSSCGDSDAERGLQAASDPVDYIIHAINGVCDAVGLYHTFQNREEGRVNNHTP